MLTHLTITDLALIERLELSFDDGLTVITGETGAGKSMLIDALELVLGGRASADLVRTGAERATVEAIFEPERRDALDALLAERGIDRAETLIVRRVISRTGRNKLFVNGCATRLDTLRALTRDLVDISGQHEHTSLLDPASQMLWLDAAAGTTADAASLAAGVSHLRRLDRERAALADRLGGRESRLDFLRFQLAEIDDIAPEPGEDEALARRAEEVERANARSAACEEATWELVERDGALVDRLAALGSRLAALGEPCADTLEAARLALLDAAGELSSRIGELDEPGDAEEIEARRDALARLKRKHRGTLEEVLETAERLREELDELESAEERLAELADERDALARSLHAEAIALARARQAAAPELAARVEAELGDLGMPACTFSVHLSYVGADRHVVPGPEDAAPDSLTSAGLDRIELRLAPNPGEGESPLARIASGGELSRVLLALKAAGTAAGDAVPTVLFDEVDTGVGGGIAEAVGRKVSRLARGRQVLAITHQAQMAAFADQHLQVRKSVVEGRTVTAVSELGKRERVGELARMLGGERITRTTRAHARELLRSCVPDERSDELSGELGEPAGALNACRA